MSLRSSARSSQKGHQDGEFLWLMSLSDLMILLFVFFVVMFSFSYQKMGAADFKRIAEVIGAQEHKADPLDEIQRKLLKWVTDRKLLESVQLERKEDSMILQIREQALFESGNSVLIPESGHIVQMIGAALSQVPAPYRVGVEGHTDDNPIKAGAASGNLDNWELSFKRAHSVMEALNLSPELKKRTVLMGFGEMKPLAPNRDPSGKAIPNNQKKNRRVTVRIF